MARKQRGITPQGTNSRTTELLLAEDVPTLGKQGEIVRVKRGYARNYLLPQGLATIATEHNKRMVQRHRLRLDELQAARMQELRQHATAVSKYSVTLEANANPEGHLYGSIGANDISKSLKGAGYNIEPHNVRLEGPLKELGMYTVKLELHPEVTTEVKVWVVPTASR